jgi:hypothetical protein
LEKRRVLKKQKKRNIALLTDAGAILNTDCQSLEPRYRFNIRKARTRSKLAFPYDTAA